MFINQFLYCTTYLFKRDLKWQVIFVEHEDNLPYIHTASANGANGTANGTPTETELPTPTSSAPEAGGNPASLALRNALRSVFRSESDAVQRNDSNAQRNDSDLPVFDTPWVYF